MPDAIPDHALVVVADGGKAHFYRRTGTGSTVTLHAERELTPDSAAEQGPSGARPGDQSPKQTGEASFTNHLSHLLHTMHQHGDYKDLVLIADPQTLGLLRSSLPKAVEAAVVRSLAKDLTNHPLKAIEAALTD